MNGSEELTFRDYKKALTSSQTTHIPVNFLENYDESLQIKDGISFISFKVYSSYFEKEIQNQQQNIIVIADEFDQIVFGDTEFPKDA